jgi:hypothetical protein
MVMRVAPFLAAAGQARTLSLPLESNIPLATFRGLVPLGTKGSSLAFPGKPLLLCCCNVSSRFAGEPSSDEPPEESAS